MLIMTIKTQKQQQQQQKIVFGSAQSDQSVSVAVGMKKSFQSDSWLTTKRTGKNDQTG